MKKVILGTDWWSDCDDVAALRVLTRSMRAEKVELLGVVVNACMQYSVASIDGFLVRDGIKNVPIGIDKNAVGFSGQTRYQERLSRYAQNYKNNDAAEDGVGLYRRLLASANEKVHIIEIGFLQIFASLLQSPGDAYCEKSGLELVREKVEKVWIMGGKWDQDGEKEHNFCLNEITRQAAKYVCEHCPVPITFLGFEVGSSVITGGNLNKEDHLYEAFLDFGAPNGRSSWDPMLTLAAVIGNENDAGYETVFGTASVDSQTGANYFKENINGKHCFLTKKQPDEYYQKIINDLIR